MLTHLFHNLFTGYLDAGLAAMIFQMLIAFFLGSLFIFKTFWSKVLLFFGKLFGIKKKDDVFGEDIEEKRTDESAIASTNSEAEKPEIAEKPENEPATSEVVAQTEESAEN